MYNLVLGDTIEGRIFLMLEEKLTEIARTLGKVDEQGRVAEDLRSQILGQLSERLSYDRLYQEALDDPEMRRTRLELEAALANASQARVAVSELFQDLEGFRLDDYRPFDNLDAEMGRILDFIRTAEAEEGREVRQVGDGLYECGAVFTTNRDLARERDDLELLGIDHPRVAVARSRWAALPAEELGLAVGTDVTEPGVLTWWRVHAHRAGGESRLLLMPLACTMAGQRMPQWERRGAEWFMLPATEPVLDAGMRMRLLKEHLEPMLLRELTHRGVSVISDELAMRLAAWLETRPLGS